MPVQVGYTFAKTSYSTVILGWLEGDLVYVALGNSKDGLLRTMKKDFKRANENYEIVSSTQDNKLTKLFEEWLDDPIKYDDEVREKIKDKYLFGTPFQVKVWDSMKKIPLGQTISYSDIAEDIKLPKSFRAVAQACGANMIPLLIPCHRVLSKSGKISGFRWGSDIKREILAKEGITVEL